MAHAPLALAFLAGALVVGALLWASFRVRLHLALRRARKDAVSLSRATVYGQVSEQLLPLFPELEYAPHDMRFLGAPIDYVVFDGYGDEGEEVTVVFVEVKTGNAKLSRGERRVRDAVRAGRVRFETVRLSSR